MNKPFSPLNSSVGVALVSVSLVLSFSTIFLYAKNHSLEKQNKALLADSKKLQDSIKTLESENQNLIAKTATDRKAIEDALAALKKENTSLQAEVKKVSEDMQSAVEEKTYLEDMLIHKTKEIEKIKSAPGATPATVQGAGANNSKDLEQKIRKKDEEIRTLTEQNKLLSKKLDRLYQTTHDKIAEINVAKITLEETIAQARKIIDNEWNTVDLGAIAANPKAAAQAPVKKPEPRKAAKKEGRVLAVNEDHGFVVVDIGKVDGISSDSTLALEKNGEPIGTLSVLEVRDVMTACNIKDLMQGKKIEINDLVLIQK